MSLGSSRPRGSWRISLGTLFVFSPPGIQYRAKYAQPRRPDTDFVTRVT